MTKTEKVAIALAIVGLIVCALFFVKAIKPLQEQIDNNGVKGIVNEIWNGKSR